METLLLLPAWSYYYRWIFIPKWTIKYHSISMISSSNSLATGLIMENIVEWYMKDYKLGENFVDVIKKAKWYSPPVPQTLCTYAHPRIIILQEYMYRASCLQDYCTLHEWIKWDLNGFQAVLCLLDGPASLY